MTDIYAEIKEVIQTAVQAAGITVEDVHLEHPSDLLHGDFATNIAMANAKILGKNPRELAESIVSEIEKQESKHIAGVSVAGPGFINITLSSEGVLNTLKSFSGDNIAQSDIHAGKKILVEYTNTNLFKEMHIGHMMGNIVGESLSRLLKTTGAEIKNSTYQGDVGLHIAKAIWGIKQNISEKPDDSASISEKTAFLGRAYAEGATQYDNPKIKKEIDEINTLVYSKTDNEINDLYAWGREVSLAHFAELYEKLDTHFDYYFFESEVAEKGKETILEYLKKGVFADSDGAVVFKGEDYDKSLHTRVFINSAGLPTYEAKDIGNSLNKYATYPFDQNIIVTAKEQDSYFKVVFKALEHIDSNIAKRTSHVSHGLLTLPTGKMGSRKGNVITGEFLLDTIQEKALEKIKDRDLDDEEKNKVSLAVGLAAIRYSILQNKLGGNIVFDIEKSLSFEGDSGPYLQYACTRAYSVLKKAQAEKVVGSFDVTPDTLSNLERHMYRYNQVVKQSATEYAPHHLVGYLTELAGEFNSWYAKEQIVNTDDDFSAYKVAVTELFSRIMKEGMGLLGIRSPERM